MISTRRRRSRGIGSARNAGAAAGAAVLVVALGFVHRLRREAGSGERGSHARGSGGAGAESWRCACGQLFRVAGIERHRVYWVEGAPEGEPVMSGQCPSCDRPLPAGPAAAAA
jgi:hypothetical protein